MLFKEYLRRGYEPIGVNPNVNEIEGQPCFARIEDVVPRPDAVLLMTSPKLSENLLQDCRKAGIPNVWIYGYSGKSTVSPLAISELRSVGIRIVNGECPFMFFPKNGFHWIHGFVRKVMHSYPS